MGYITCMQKEGVLAAARDRPVRHIAHQQLCMFTSSSFIYMLVAANQFDLEPLDGPTARIRTHPGLHGGAMAANRCSTRLVARRSATCSPGGGSAGAAGARAHPVLLLCWRNRCKPATTRTYFPVACCQSEASRTLHAPRRGAQQQAALGGGTLQRLPRQAARCSPLFPLIAARNCAWRPTGPTQG